MPFPNSLRLRITALAVATSAAVVVAFGWLFVELLTNRLVNVGESELVEVVSRIDGFALADLGESDARFLTEDGEYILALEMDDLGDVLVEVYWSDSPEDEPIGAFVLDSETSAVRDVINESAELTQDELRQVTAEGREAISEIAGDLASEQRGLVEATEDVINNIDDAVQAAQRTTFIIGPLLVLATGLITWVVVGRALAPTRRIAAEAAAISPETLDRRITHSGRNDEVDTIAAVINNMLDRIENGLRREQQFVADASHELRTPLAITRMAAELVAADAPTSEYPPQILDELDRMQHLVDDLLHLSSEPIPTDHAKVELGTLIAEVVQAHPAGQLLRADIDDGLVVRGHREELRRVIVNLLDNAQRFTDTQIDVTATATSTDVVVHVDDDGPGIDAADRTRIFDRFVRLDEGRARHDGGSGLGLAIVQAIVERHHGSVAVGESPTRGARFTVRLPALSTTINRQDPAG